jgi:hypothetical protein
MKEKRPFFRHFVHRSSVFALFPSLALLSVSLHPHQDARCGLQNDTKRFF